MATQYDPDKYERNKMDITEQQSTFAGFMRWSMYVSVATILVLVYLLLTKT